MTDIAKQTTAVTEQKAPKSKPLELPTTKSVVKTSIYDYVTLIHGEPKIGKSSFCAEMDNALFLAFEPGLDALSVFKLPEGDAVIETWKELSDIYLLLKGGNHNYKVVIWDTATAAYNVCYQHVTKLRGVEPAEEKEWGGGWGKLNSIFLNTISKFASLPLGLVLICHTKELKLKSKTG
jgi:hypothetical protein